MDAGKWTTAKQLREMTGAELKEFFDGMSDKEREAFFQRLSDEAEAEARAAWIASEPWWAPAALVITGLSVVLPIIFLVVHWHQPSLLFRGFAVSAAVVGAAAAGVRLRAHPNLKKLDGFGKMLGFSAALLATFAAGVLLLGDANKVLEHGDSPSSPPTSVVSPPTNQGRFGSNP